ncbi:MAG: ABC transporter ATP-binding protein [Acutalibacteraceae bacterium]|nr:ABC transporter ATP-binding protein [Acutalibacteraceae bacterium]
MFTLLKSVREYKWVSIITPIFKVLEVIMEVLIPYYMAYLIDYGVDKGDLSVVWKIGILLVGLSFLSLFFGIAGGVTSAKAATGFAKNLRKDMFYNVQKFSFSNIDKFSTSSIVTRLTTDVGNIQMAYQMSMVMAVRAPIMLIVAIVASFKINSQLAWIYVACVPIIGVAMLFLTRNAHPIFNRVFKTYDKLNNIVQENVRGIRVVKSFVREDYETKKFKDVSSEIYNDFARAEKLMALANPVMSFCSYGCIVLISWFGAKLIVASGNNPQLGFTTGQLMSLITYASSILISLMMFSIVIVMLTISRASIERAVEILKEKSDIKNPANPVTEVADGSIVFENVNFSYKKDSDNYCLKNINLNIKSGETIGIIGGTGSSKSSLVQLISRLYDVSTGSVKVGSVDVKDYDLDTLRNSVAVVLQKNVLFSGTIKENLRWGNPDATDEELIHACQLAQAHDFVESFPDKYDTYIEQGGTNVSGGQKQRLCIARALLKKPKVIILDDSTSAVDTKTDALIRQAFMEEIPNTTKLIIAQRISSVQDADKIIVMNNGCIDAVGTHSQLLESNEIYSEVYYSQMKGAEL